MARAGQLPQRWKHRAGALLLALSSVALHAGWAEPPPPPSLEGLLAHLAASPGLRARVEEQKHISLLREPLVSRGTLAFVPPQLLIRVMDEPGFSRLVIDADEFRYQAEGAEGRVEIRAHPPLRALVDGMRQLFAGDADALAKSFETAWQADAADPMAWRLTLRPREAAMREYVSRLEVAGRGFELQELRVVESGGDETRMRFHDVDLRHVFDTEEISQLSGSAVEPGSADR